MFLVPSKATKEELLKEEKRLKEEIKKPKGDFFLMYGLAKQLEAVQKQLSILNSNEKGKNHIR